MTLIGMCYIPLSAKGTSGTQSNWMAVTGPQLQVKIKKINRHWCLEGFALQRGPCLQKQEMHDVPCP